MLRSLFFIFTFWVISFLALGNPPGSPQALPHASRGIVSYGAAPLFWVFVLILMGILAVVFLWALFRKYGKKAKSREIPIDWPKVILGRIKVLEPEEPFLKKAQENYYYELGLNLRHFIEVKTSLKATDKTFKELKKPLMLEMKSLGLESSKILDFLEQSEWIKFSDRMGSQEKALFWKTEILSLLAELSEAVSVRDEARQANEEMASKTSQTGGQKS